MVSIPMMLSIVILGALGAFFFVCTQRENHSSEISRLQQNHSDQLARSETAHARELSILRETIEARVESAYRSGRASSRPHVFKGEEQTGSWFWKTKRDLAVAVVLDEDGNVLAFAGDGSKIHSLEMPSEVKKAITALSGPVGKVLASVVV